MCFPSDDPVDSVLISYLLFQSKVYRLKESTDSPNTHGRSWLITASEANMDGRMCLLSIHSTCAPSKMYPRKCFLRYSTFTTYEPLKFVNVILVNRLATEDLIIMRILRKKLMMVSLKNIKWRFQLILIQTTHLWPSVKLVCVP